MAAPTTAVLALVSAVAVALLGVVVLLPHPRRRQQVFFGLFAVSWGVSAILANVGRVLVDPDVHKTGVLLSSAFLLPTFLFLVHFATLIRQARAALVASWVAAAVAGAGAAALMADPALVVERVVDEGDGVLRTTQGALLFPLFHLPLYAAFYFAVVTFYLQYRASAPGTARHRFRGMLIGLALYVSYASTQWLSGLVVTDEGVASFASGSVEVAGGVIPLLQNVTFLLGFLLMAGMAVHAAIRPPPPEGRDAGLLLAMVMPLVVAALERVLGPVLGKDLETLGFWRIMMVAVFVYTLSRYQLFDLDIKAKRFAGPVTAGILVLFGIPVATSLMSGNVNGIAIGITVLGEAIGIGGVLVFQDKLREALFPGVSNNEDYLHQRKIELYRVALEDAIARGTGPDAEDLRELRLRLGVNDNEHRLLAWVVKPGGSGPDPVQSVDVGDVVLERYRVTRSLGQGTHGRTFVALDLKTKTEVAVKAVGTKALDGEAAKILLREARLAASIAHPNIIRILDVAEGRDMVIVVMEYADHGNFEAYLQRRGALPLEASVAFLDQLLGALDAAHAKHIVHRNLKPKNVLIEEDGSVRLADFGAARAQAMVASPTTDASTTLLSPLYQSPEQLRGEPATERSDLFVAGVLFHEALAGKFYVPIAGRDDLQIRALILAGAKPGPLDLGGQPPWVASFLARALALDPRRRFASAAEMRKELAALAGTGVEPVHAVVRPRARARPAGA